MEVRSHDELGQTAVAFQDMIRQQQHMASLLTDRLERALGRADRLFRRIAVLFIDNFKLINDGLGHGAGDRLLVAFAEHLRGCVRAGDTAARLRGDEFILLLEHIASSSEATDVAERIAELLHAPISVGDRQVVVTASIGIALNTPDHERTESILRNADLALYRAKAAGTARCAQVGASSTRSARSEASLAATIGVVSSSRRSVSAM
jgi:diguanylate cyclase (GGDEF)-like protein